jgi:uncharacterized protein (UPF0332 family)
MSAETLLKDGDHDGACDRAYYAMFNAARAMLDVFGPTSLAGVKTCSSVLRLFSEVFVVPRLVDRDLGRGLNLVQGLRLRADYARTGVSKQDAENAVAIMRQMLDSAESFLKRYQVINRGNPD